MSVTHSPRATEAARAANLARTAARLEDLDFLIRTGEDPAERLRNLIGERQQETVEILRNWLEEENA